MLRNLMRDLPKLSHLQLHAAVAVLAVAWGLNRLSVLVEAGRLEVEDLDARIAERLERLADLDAQLATDTPPERMTPKQAPPTRPMATAPDPAGDWPTPEDLDPLERALNEV